MSRRRVLVAGPAVAALGTLSACTGSEPAPAPVDPDRVTLESALAAEETLGAALAAWTFDSSALRTEALAVSSRHISALQDALGTGSPTPSVSPTTPTSTPSSDDDLLRVLDQTTDAHTRALRGASPALVPLLASLAASDAALAAAVRREAR